MLARLVSPSDGRSELRPASPSRRTALDALRLAAVLPVIFGLLSVKASAQASCTTGLCLQQLSCPGGGTTSITGTVYAPNGTDPLPNVLVYIPNAAIDPFPSTVSCVLGGAQPSGSPIVGTTTSIDGTFTLTNVPVGTNIPLVIQTGHWRRQVTVPTVASCANTPFSTRFATTQAEGDIPKIAIATGSEDGLECVLRKVGIADSEFTDGGGTGRINLFKGGGSPGAQIDAATGTQASLMNSAAVLNQYDMVMFPCQGGRFEQTTAAQNNLISFANAGGRVYTTHYSYVWLYDDPPFQGTADWNPNQANLPDGIATIDQSYPGGQTLAAWLQNVGATTTQGQIAISTLRHDQSGVNNPPSQSVMTLNFSGNPVMQFTFATPIGVPAANQCGKVLFNEYHVENPPSSLSGKTFPTECPGGAMSPQEKLLEFSLFDLSGNSVIPTLTPVSQDFGSIAVGISTGPQTFVWSNPSPFPVNVSSVTTTGDFAVASNNCALVGAGSSCQITATFTPTAVGARAGKLSVVSGQTTLSSILTGAGVPDLQLSSAALAFGNVDIGGVSAAQTVTLTNAVPSTVALLPIVLSNDYIDTTTCGASLGPMANCTISVVFKPLATGPRPGTLVAGASNTAYGNATTTLTGNGVDFSLTVAPTSGAVIAGLETSTVATLTPIGGFSATVALSCTTNAAGSACTPASASVTSATAVNIPFTITTTAHYAVVGYGGFSGGVLLSLAGLACGAMVWMRRRRAGMLLRGCLMVLVLAGVAAWTTGCSGKDPAVNSPYTAPGTYTYTVTASDGFLTRSATYSLTVTAK